MLIFGDLARCFCCRKCEDDYVLFQLALTRRQGHKPVMKTLQTAVYRHSPTASQSHLAGAVGYLNLVCDAGEVCINCGAVGGYQ